MCSFIYLFITIIIMFTKIVSVNKFEHLKNINYLILENLPSFYKIINYIQKILIIKFIFSQRNILIPDLHSANFFKLISFSHFVSVYNVIEFYFLLTC